jgi:hypothetical protein
MRSSTMSAVFAVVLAIALGFGTTGCEDVPQAFDLDHARIMAIRAEPPALAPEATAAIDVLFTDSSIEPRVAAPDAITIRLPAEAAAFADYLVRTADGWRLTAPDAATIDAIRASLGLAADDPLAVPLEFELATADGPLTAVKLVTIGATAANPAAPAIMIDGTPGAAAVQTGIDAELAASPTAGDDHVYRWFSSVGELDGFTRPTATLSPELEPPRTTGHLAVVVRDAAGGVAWTIVPIAVAP